MVWDQARAKQLVNELQGMMGEGGKASRQVGPLTKTTSPHPWLKVGPSRTGKGVELRMWVVQFCSSLCVLLLQKSQGGRSVPCPDEDSPPRSSLETTDTGSDQRANKRGFGRCLLRTAGSEVSVAFCARQKESLVEPSKKPGRENRQANRH